MLADPLKGSKEMLRHPGSSNFRKQLPPLGLSGQRKGETGEAPRHRGKELLSLLQCGSLQWPQWQILTETWQSRNGVGGPRPSIVKQNVRRSQFGAER